MGKQRSRTCGGDYEQLGEELREVLRRVQTQLEERVRHSVQKLREELRSHFQSMDELLVQQHEVFRSALEELVVEESSFTCGEQDIIGSNILEKILESVQHIEEGTGEEHVCEHLEHLPVAVATCSADIIEPELEIEVWKLADHVYFDAMLDRRTGNPIGLAVRQDDTERLRVFVVEPGLNATAEWNTSVSRAEKSIEPGDVIVSVNGLTDPSSIITECKKCELLCMRVAKPLDPEGESE
jgi:hypothetical protein